MPLAALTIPGALPAPTACSGVTTALVISLPSLRTERICEYSSREDLIEVLLASAHLPLMMDWTLSCRWVPPALQPAHAAGA
jgi:hypothetical protein